jgi:hypothetical protein
MYSIATMFPTVLYKDSYKGNLFDEYVFCKQLETEPLPEGALVSKNKSVLEGEQFYKVKACLEHALKTYARDVMSYDCELYITQSWVSTLPKGTSLPTHRHSDSFISGVLYFTNESRTPMVFESHDNTPQPTIIKQTPFNSRTWRVSGEKGGFVLFPSPLAYHIETNENNMDLVALSFNTSLKLLDL